MDVLWQCDQQCELFLLSYNFGDSGEGGKEGAVIGDQNIDPRIRSPLSSSATFLLSGLNFVCAWKNSR